MAPLLPYHNIPGSRMAATTLVLFNVFLLLLQSVNTNAGGSYASPPTAAVDAAVHNYPPEEKAEDSYAAPSANPRKYDAAVEGSTAESAAVEEAVEECTEECRRHKKLQAKRRAMRLRNKARKARRRMIRRFRTVRKQRH